MDTPLLTKNAQPLGRKGETRCSVHRISPSAHTSPIRKVAKKMAKEAASYRVSNTCRAEST